MASKKLCVKCPNCGDVFPSRFQAESPIQLLFLYFYCSHCGRIFYCKPQDFYERVDKEFKTAFRREDAYSRVPAHKVQLAGPHIFYLNNDVILDSIEKAIVGNKAVIADKSCPFKISVKEIGKIRNPKLRDSLELLCKSFFEALYARFFPEYGSWYDRIRLLIEGNPESIAIILENRSDLKEEKLHNCVFNAKKCLNILLIGDVCKTDPHASTLEGYQDELSLFIAELFDEVERKGWEFYANEEAKNKLHLEKSFPDHYIKYEDYLYNDKPFSGFISPLQNFISANNIKLDSGAEIRNVTNEELLNLVRPNEWGENKFHFYPGIVICVPVYCENGKDVIYNIVTEDSYLPRINR